MDRKVKLTYLFTLKYRINLYNWTEWKNRTSVFDRCKIGDTEVIGASLKSQHYGLDVTDVVDFMEQFRPHPLSIIGCLTK